MLLLLLALPGITPACAGKTKAGLEAISEDEDHPRVCGKDPKVKNLIPKAKGSPPRVRERLI